MQARIYVTLKNGVLDPQGAAISQALATQGFSGVSAVRQGKVFDLEIDAPNAAAAQRQAEEMARKLLANMVIEDFSVEITL